MDSVDHSHNVSYHFGKMTPVIIILGLKVYLLQSYSILCNSKITHEGKISTEGVQPDAKKLYTLTEIPPTNKKSLESFLV